MILTEGIMSRLNLVESKKDDGSLATFSGVFAEYDKKNLNGRIYSRSLWERVVNDPDVVNRIKTRVLFGELDHPTDRIETITEKSAWAITDLHLDEATKTVQGTGKVLDTPAGRILYTLLKFGSVLGVSSRGEGTMMGEQVDPESYNFVTFDIVTNPSNVGAHPSVTEGVDNGKTIAEALIESTSTADTKGLKLIEEASTGFDTETAKTIINKVEERRGILSEESQEDTPKDKDDAYLQKLEELGSKITKLSEIIESLVKRHDETDKILESFKPHDPTEPDQTASVVTEDSHELVDTGLTEREVTKVVAARKRVLTENTGDSVKVVVEASNIEKPTSDTAERIGRIVSSSKSK